MNQRQRNDSATELEPLTEEDRQQIQASADFHAIEGQTSELFGYLPESSSDRATLTKKLETYRTSATARPYHAATNDNNRAEYLRWFYDVTARLTAELREQGSS
ncbi:uncharacterized protein I303_105817 [Kwoniella dejecticola CBS 10117]|uniref:Uncharacterized protein n=1 Tax=Kwoniella dejecticola CBS 10117 TaxID=1296121 RepID=A0A1A6A0G4_9TREE|nr:uncharacterized protein I303_05839 [Kwoniella dejecticola CBS 10117]OBR83559.1 hypothetical protein I303_05839 [Kwoniella dejecticola CBS 10117]